jgi:hypothetical protein
MPVDEIKDVYTRYSGQYFSVAIWHGFVPIFSITANNEPASSRSRKRWSPRSA